MNGNGWTNFLLFHDQRLQAGAMKRIRNPINHRLAKNSWTRFTNLQTSLNHRYKYTSTKDEHFRKLNYVTTGFSQQPNAAFFCVPHCETAAYHGGLLTRHRRRALDIDSGIIQLVFCLRCVSLDNCLSHTIWNKGSRDESRCGLVGVT